MKLPHATGKASTAEYSQLDRTFRFTNTTCGTITEPHLVYVATGLTLWASLLGLAFDPAVVQDFVDNR